MGIPITYKCLKDQVEVQKVLCFKEIMTERERETGLSLKVQSYFAK